jgi:poly(3-hydroxybutyrate) depolymerase
MFGANNPNACFNWFEPEHATRDRGEALSIRQMIDKVRYVPQCGRPIPSMQLRPQH